VRWRSVALSTSVSMMRSTRLGATVDVGCRRWIDGRMAWGEQHGIDAVNILREQVEMRRAAYSWVDGHASRQRSVTTVRKAPP
jgi:hypothetical protein